MTVSPLQFLKDHGVRHVRLPNALHFPSEELVPETRRHLELRTLLFAILRYNFSDRATLGSDQFVYFDPTNPNRRLAPDAFVCLGPRDAWFDSWKTWERGTPQLAVEIASDSDSAKVWEEKLGRYHALGVQELVWFDADAIQDKRLRVWDRIDGDLVERIVEADSTPCSVLGLWWVVVRSEQLGPVLRLARDSKGQQLLLSSEEAERQAFEAEHQARQAERQAFEAEHQARQIEQEKRVAAERRVAELEEELKRRGLR